MTSGLEGKSLDEVCEWLEDEEFPDLVVSTFRGKETCKSEHIKQKLGIWSILCFGDIVLQSLQTCSYLYILQIALYKHCSSVYLTSHLCVWVAIQCSLSL